MLFHWTCRRDFVFPCATKASVSLKFWSRIALKFAIRSNIFWNFINFSSINFTVRLGLVRLFSLSLPSIPLSSLYPPVTHLKRILVTCWFVCSHFGVGFCFYNSKRPGTVGFPSHQGRHQRNEVIPHYVVSFRYTRQPFFIISHIFRRQSARRL